MPKKKCDNCEHLGLETKLDLAQFGVATYHVSNISNRDICQLGCAGPDEDCPMIELPSGAVIRRN